MGSPAAALRLLARPTTLLRVPPGAVDAALVGGRVVLAIVCAADIWWRESAGSARTVLTDGLVFYGLFSAAVAIGLWRSHDRDSALRSAMGVLDAFAVGLLTLVDDPFGAHLILVLSYALVVTGYRGGMRDAMATTGLVGVGLIARLGRHLLFAGSSWLAGPSVLPLAAVCVVFTWFHATRQAATARAAAAARLIGSVRAERGPSEIFRAVLEELLRLSTARAAIVSLEHRASGRIFIVRLPRPGGTWHVKFEPLPRARRNVYFFECACATTRAHAPQQERAEVRVLATGTGQPRVPEAFLTAHPCHRLDAFAFTAADEWDGRLFLLDPADLDIRQGRRRWLHGFLQELVPAVQATCDLSGLRTRAAARERARIGRELHDGIVQELARLDIELELLRRSAWTPEIVQGIERVQHGLQTELAQLRSLLQGARSHDVDPSRLKEVLADAVERFTGETGITARFVCDEGEVILSPQVCGEITRIVNEALVNVRRHSGAKNVLVRFGCDEGQWRLSIQDDGRGFQTWVPLGRGEPVLRPPAVIAERVHAIGAQLQLRVGAGAHLDIALGQQP